MIKRLMKCIREYKKASILTPVYVSIEVALEVAIPLLMARLIDNGIDKGDMSVILTMGGLLLVCALASLAMGALSGKQAAFASAGFAKNLRHDMYYNVQDFSFSNIDKFSTGSIVTRLTTDVTNVQQAYQMIIRMAVRSPIMLICSMLAAFSINSELALIFAVTLPVLGVGLYLIISKVHPVFRKVFKTYDHLNNTVSENLRGIRVVKSFVREEHEKEKFNDISEQIYKDFSKAEKLIALNGPLMQLCVFTSMLLIAWFGSRIIVACGGDAATGLSTGGLMSLMTYTMQIMMSLMMLSIVFVMITISRASGERIVELLNEKSDLNNCADPVYEVKDGSIRFDNVEFSYSRNSGKPCLSGVSLDIAAGETIGILGGTGSSKSSLVQLIPRLYDVTSGSVSVGGVDVRNYDIETLRNSVAMVLQKNVLFSGTINENLRWGNADATDEQIAHVCRVTQSDSFIERFPDKYETYIEQGGTNVSGGQRQRLCIARALLKSPKVLILDDSTSAVDTNTDAKIRHAFKEEMPDITKLIIAQRVSSVMDADRIIVLDDGKISAFGTHEELMQTSDIYREVYESQTGGMAV